MKKSTVLIVDDNVETLETIALMAKQMKFGHICTAKNASEAIRTIQISKQIDLIICDWNMPEQSGIELLKQLRAYGNLVPFIMVTARSDVDSVLQAREEGVDLYISKPFSMDEFMRKVEWVRDNGGMALNRMRFEDKLN